MIPPKTATGTDVSTETARGLLVDMVSTPSVSGDEEAAAERLAAFFDAHDREVWLDDVGNVRAPADDAVLFTSHVDTVPGDVPVRLTANGEAAEGDAVAGNDSVAAPDEELHLDDAATVQDAVLWGRGSVDATGPLCAMAVAAVRTGCSFAGVVGEETDSRGARHLVETREPPAALVNGEPSGVDGITLGYRGLVAGTYAATTESTHASRPEPTAVQDAMAWWAAVESTCDALPSPEDASGVDDPTPSEQSTFESVTTKPVAVEGGPADDGLAVEARVDFQVRVPPGLSVETVESTLASVTADFAGGLELTDAIPPVMTSPRTSVARAFRVAIRAADSDPRLLRKTGTSDMNVFAAAWDRPMVTYGPGDSSLDHAPDEHLSLAAYDRSIAVLDAVGRRLVDAGQSNRPPITDPSPTDSDPQ
ncbi:N-acetyl-ornithine/N-acetyl-lysine deacetylase [Halovivax ruber XH-70]|uniref:Putative [LysW]-lysine/[LysW]-ornithine hydrolase n=1 Tax=Halovivax ruber (strain DSM 18193 / JCM 13892 / XH-70) TaxID=797302 RepID=L0I9X7_HALRX|nr:[LysW]-lysine hydrolase [Halovivax ruber]AGB15046.1 N-acetyl-ornithine/N-acetyl-lysine deacetylase [Halovivax ruber XH-70]